MGDRAINKEIKLPILTTSEVAVRKSKEKHSHYINVTLSETETINHFTLQGCVISMCDPSCKSNDQNEGIKNTIKPLKESRKAFCERSAQTFHPNMKTKVIMISPPVTCDVGCNIPDIIKTEKKSSHVLIEEILESTMKNLPECLLEINNFSSTKSAKQEETRKSSINKLSECAQSRSFLKNLQFVERAVTQNSYFTALSKYRGAHVPCQTDKRILNPPLIEKILCLKFAKNVGMGVICMGWHKLNNDVLSVGYGNESNSGLIILWSLLNPGFPERVIQADGKVMSLDFSKHKPSLLAAGFYDGTVKVFDTSSNDEVTMIADSSFAIGRHHLPVMQLCWVNCKDNTEQIVSISSDGRVLQWSLKKGLTMTPLMTLRVDNKMKQSNISSNIIGLMGAVNDIY